MTASRNERGNESMPKKSLDPKDFAWVPIGYGACVIMLGVGVLVLVFETFAPHRDRIPIGILIMSGSLAIALVGAAVFLFQVASGKKL